MGTKLDDRKAIVQESDKTKKARQKLTDRIQKIDQKVTKKALDEKKEQITDWISRHSWGRESVSSDFTLFDKNRNSAPVSKKTKGIIEKLEKDHK